MDIKFVLDFDGVLFNSAFEAYTVANLTTEGMAGYRQDISYEEFLVYRGVVTDAWHYNRLYSINNGVPASALHEVTPNAQDWEFSRLFFEARKTLMADPNWPKVMAPYDFFQQIKPLLLQRPEYFAVLSTRNTDSIRETLVFHGVENVPIFGQEDIRRLGSKLAVAKEQRWLEKGRWLIVYIDDMNNHLEPFEGQIHLPLHANWGYDQETACSLSDQQILTIISSLLSLAESHHP